MKSRIPNEAQPTYHNQPNLCHFEDIRALGNFKAFSKVFASCFFTFGSSGGEALWKDAALGLNPVKNQTDLVVLMHGIS